MLDQRPLSQQQTGGSVQTSNPQSVPSSNLQPQQSGLQGMGSQVLGTSTFLEQSSSAAIKVNAQGVDKELTDLRANQETQNTSVQSFYAGREPVVIGGIVILIAVLIYVLVKQVIHERS
jgi:hypothetical protein